MHRRFASLQPFHQLSNGQATPRLLQNHGGLHQASNDDSAAVVTHERIPSRRIRDGTMMPTFESLLHYPNTIQCSGVQVSLRTPLAPRTALTARLGANNGALVHVAHPFI